jgi:hypothetical protein
LNVLRPDVPAELATVVAKMLAKQPVDRYQTPAEVDQALKPFYKASDRGPAAAGERSVPPSAPVPVTPKTSPVVTPSITPARRPSVDSPPVLAQLVSIPTPQRLAHSGLGILSCIIALISAIMIAVFVASVAVAVGNPKVDEKSPHTMVVGFAYMAAIGLTLLGAVLGAVGLFQTRKTFFAWTGMIFNGLMLLGMVSLTVLGLLMG